MSPVQAQPPPLNVPHGDEGEANAEDAHPGLPPMLSDEDHRRLQALEKGGMGEKDAWSEAEPDTFGFDSSSTES